jgi:hypothetical protein
MRALKWILFVLSSVVILPAAAYAQASIAGVVKDTSGAVLPGVTVEASSPALIEKVRSAVTNGTGDYRIVNLRPGIYTVTFSLTGFSTIKREGIELIGSFSASINAELKVGTVTETVTVSAQSPIVDVQSTTSQRVLTKEIIDALPTGRSHLDQVVLIPGASSSQGAARGSLMDVGGTNNIQNTLVSIHGGRQSDTRLMYDGVRLGNFAGEGEWTNYVPDQGAAQEVVVDYAAITAEQMTSGLRVNLIPREGGNRFNGSMFGTFVNSSWQASNISQDLIDRGLGAPNSMKEAYDFNPSGGGPLKRDRLWLYVSARFMDNESYTAGTYVNKNAGDPTKWLYDPDTNQQSIFYIRQNMAGARLTYQATPRNKFSVYYDNQSRNWNDGIANVSPESMTMWRFPRLGLAQASWTSPITTRLLFEGRFALKAESFYDGADGSGGIPGQKADRAFYQTMIPVIDSKSGLFYRAPAANGQASIYGSTNQNIRTAQASLAYVTGAHAFKVGFSDTWASLFGTTFDNIYSNTYTFFGSVPTTITERTTPYITYSNVKGELGAYAQDTWTVRRLTVNAGVRFDYLAGYFPEQSFGPALFAPSRNITLPYSQTLSWKDLTPRLGAAYDLFGTGKTALKVNLGRYVQASTATINSPFSSISNLVTRSWNPSVAPGSPNYYIPQCNLLNPLANGDCGAISNLSFGQVGAVATTSFDPAVFNAWGARPENWQFGAVLQHELRPRVGVEVGYYRSWFGNFQVTDNLATSASDYSQYSIPAPLDARLSGGGGYTVGGLYNLNQNRVGQVNNYVTFANAYGNMFEHTNYLDFSMNARPRAGMLVQGGVSVGRTSVDACEVRDKLPEFVFTAYGVDQQAYTINTTNPYCHIDGNFLTQVKLLGTYLLPKADVLLSGTFQSVPGFQILAPYVATNAVIQPSLGRPLSGGAANATVGLIPSGSMYNDRANQLDLRIGKLLRYGRTRTNVSLNIYNVLNANPVLLQNNNFAVWQTPQKLLDARLFKISAQFDF